MPICLGGTHSQPSTWVRFTPDGDSEQYGRVEGCKVETTRPQLKGCYGCPAFRGIDRDGIVRDITAPNGDLVAMTMREYEAWQEDPDAFWEGQANGSVWSLQHSGTLDWDEWWAGWMRSYRQRQTDEQRARQRETTRLRVARWRARQKAGNGDVKAAGNKPSKRGFTDSVSVEGSLQNEVESRARARAGDSGTLRHRKGGTG